MTDPKRAPKIEAVDRTLAVGAIPIGPFPGYGEALAWVDAPWGNAALRRSLKRP